MKKALTATLVALACANASAANSYKVIDLGNLGDDPTYAYGVNNNNVAVGYSTIPDPVTTTVFYNHGFYFDQAAGINDMGAIINENNSPDLSVAFAINDNDLIVGYSSNRETKTDAEGNETEHSIERAIYTQKASNELQLVPLMNGADSQKMRALAVNNNQVIVGFGEYDPPGDLSSEGVELTTRYDRGFIYKIGDDALTVIGTLNSEVQVDASLRDVNDNGIAVGWSVTEPGTSVNIIKGFYVDVELPEQLHSMAFLDDETALPWAINNSGTIVGKSLDVANNTYVGFSYDITTQEAVSLGFLSDEVKFSEAFDINENNQIVGYSVMGIYPTLYGAFLYENGEMKNLNNLIDCKLDPSAEPIGLPDWHLHSARSINDNGVIVGSGVFDGGVHGFMLIPSDDPPVACQQVEEEDNSGSGSLGLFTAVLLLLGSRRNFSKKA